MNTVKQELWFVAEPLRSEAVAEVRRLKETDGDADAYLCEVVARATADGMIVSADAIESHYENVEHDSYRPLGVAGVGKERGQKSKVGYRTVVAHMGTPEAIVYDEDMTDDEDVSDVAADDRTADDSVVAGEPMSVTVAQLRLAVERADVADKSKHVELVDAIGRVDWNDETRQPNMVQLAKALGRSRATVQNRYKGLVTFLTSERFADFSAV